MSAQLEYLVLREAVEARDVVELADDLGWVRGAETTRAHYVLASRRYAAPDGTDVTYLEDHTADVRFLEIRGVGRADVARILRDRLSHYTEDELLEAAHAVREPVECIRAISRLSVMRPEHLDARYLEAHERMLNHDSPSVRRAAIRTAYGCRWPELLARVQARLRVEDRLQPQLDQLRATMVEAARHPG